MRLRSLKNESHLGRICFIQMHSKSAVPLCRAVLANNIVNRLLFPVAVCFFKESSYTFFEKFMYNFENVSKRKTTENEHKRTSYSDLKK